MSQVGQQSDNPEDVASERRRAEAWEVLVELGVQERHFNDLESRYRTLASTWLLATFAGLGFIATQEVYISFPREILMSIVAFAGSSGIYFLWNLDIMVYHKLLDACFLAGVLLENETEGLPKFRTEMLRSAPKTGGVLRRIILFYIGSIIVVTSLGVIIFISWLQTIWGWPAWILAVLAVFGIVVLIRYIRDRSLAKSYGWEEVEERGFVS
ncbi:MAG: hypothetical protein QM619_09885 [Micropruina sp.]|uniref:hypothetical protein n=1 Tax=Micropruina sp. TaxID=2737536 RepID=UPI0039E5EA40